MALNASGPISLGGSTLGQSINLELDLASNAQVSMNDVAVRKLAGLEVTMTPISIPGDFWGKSAASYWIGKYIGTNMVPIKNGYSPMIFTSSTGRIYGIMQNNNSLGGVIFEIDTNTGNVVRAKRHDPTYGTTATIYSMMEDSSGNLWGVGEFSQSASYDHSWVVKFDSNLNILNSWGLIPVLATENFGHNITVNPINGDIAFSQASHRIIFTSSLTFRFRFDISPVTVSNSGTSCDSSGNYYEAWALDTDATPDKGGLIKRDKDGNTLSIISNATHVFSAISKVYNDSWMAIEHYRAVSGQVYVGRYSTSFINSWAKGLNTITTSSLIGGPNSKSIDIDNNGNIYHLVITTTNLTSDTYVIAKWDSNGTLLWQRKILFPIGMGTKPSIVVDNLSSAILIHVTGRATQTPYAEYVFKLPQNGSGTGTYILDGQTVEYSVSSYAQISDTPDLTGGTATSTSVAQGYYSGPNAISYTVSSETFTSITTQAI